MNTLLRFTLCWLMISSSYASETITYLHHNLQGSIVDRSDADGNFVGDYHYQAYGKAVDNAVPSQSPGYTSKPHFEKLGLTYYGARWYDSNAGRFISIDPVSWQVDNPVHSFNRYAYANNNPYKFVDPDGRIAETIFDLVSLGLSIEAFHSEPSLLNALGVAYDGVAAIVPFMPAGVGAIRQTGHVGELVSGISDIGVAKSVGSFSASARNGVGQVYSPKVTMTGKNITFDGFSVGTQKGLFGTGQKGATELIGPMRDLVKFAQKNGANTVSLKGKYETPEGAALGGGKVGDNFSFSFPATNQGFKGFIRTLRD